MTKKGQTYLILIFTLSTILALVFFVFTNHFGVEEESFRILIRWSAKLAAVLFAIAFVSSSLDYFFTTRTTKKLLSLRPMIGLSFMVFHTFHLFSLIYLQRYIHPVFELAKPVSLLAGSIAYFFMYAMAISTFPYIKRKIPEVLWSGFHTTGSYWIWVIFFNSYLKNVINKEQYYFLFTLYLIVFILRLARTSHKYIKK